MTRLCSQSSQAQGVLPALPGASEPLTRGFFQHTQLEIKAQKPNHRADTRLPNAFEAENPDTREHGPAGFCNWWAPNPNLSPPSGPSQKPVPRLCSSSWLPPLTLCVPLCSQLRAHPRRCVRPPSAAHPRSLPASVAHHPWSLPVVSYCT